MKRIIYGVLAALLLLPMAACSTVPDNPDEMGLHYAVGNIDGNTFEACINPGENGPATWNDEIYWLPTNLRTWIIDDAPGADYDQPIVVLAAPQPDQPSGVQVKVETKTNFKLNTNCDGAKNSPVVKFWESIGRRYQANTDEGWKRMLEVELVRVQQNIIKDVVRQYQADPLIADVATADGKSTLQTEAERQIAERLAVEFNRLSGGEFFCGPTFNRTSGECPALELLILSVDFADPGIRAAQNEKKKAIELAAAQLAAAQGQAAALIAEAEGRAKAAAALNELYNSPGWVALQKQIEAGKALIEACKMAKECRIVIGPDGAMIMA